MKRIIWFLIAAVLALPLAAVCFAAPDTAVIVYQPPTLMAWFTVNEKVIMRLALSISEFLALFKFFQGNGILDTFIKAGKSLTATQDSSQ